MRFAMVSASLAFGMSAVGAYAQVTSVTATATVTRTFRPDVSGNPIVSVTNGPIIAADDGSAVFGSGASFQSTSNVDPNAVSFRNGNAAAGEVVTVDSHTIVDISFRNNGATAVRPLLDSTIIPAGFGIYVGNNCLNNIASCGPDTPIIRPTTFAAFGPASRGDGTRIAGASFDFKVRNGDNILYDLTGSFAYVRDPVTGVRSFVTDLTDAQAALAGFRLSSPPGSDTQYGYQWDATNIALQFPDLLAPGAETSLTYETTVTSFSFTPCTTLLTGVCLNSYASFGDPLGKGSRVPTHRGPGRAGVRSRVGWPLSRCGSTPSGSRFPRSTRAC